ncbi:16S rRNA (cytosine(967)-C(5))-methyltransferase RsmB [Seongchinamella sediminis]|uniref:16S rRNA (cytosine(967)-C(5))-methyltransferase n=1 Tax=Seongchinamella sediminis TaxID=2283635 RepID=A0A3L7DX00_9GAMM|nr:16S rRNA (cytosine(967)-C(5))-methyltransferase RsmB [Seongchinamella sediminis]RLQ22087.1 16S rRNA (cytosine(967)-C(5))-methyltransferase RsmB [Seongchinamella sediminis]
MARDTRATAAGVLAGVLAGKSLNQLLPAALDQVSARDRGLLQQLCYGTLRQAPRLQSLLEQLLAKPLRDKDRDVLGLLLCGLYQLEDTRIPDHAAVSATVAATRALKKPWAKGLANAVLRRFLRERESLLATLDSAAAAAHPRWLYEAIHRQWPEQASTIIAANNSQPPMTLRVNSARGSREHYLQALDGAGIGARAGTISADAIYLDAALDVAELPGFGDGLVSVQDEAAQLAALLLAAEAGDRVLDACAAPGGKSCHILERQPGLGELVAMDVDPERLVRVEDNLQRLQLQAAVLVGDAARPPAELAAASFDRILVDAPCSASGVIRRHPDVKLLRREEDIAAFAGQQLAILAGLWPLLKPGGRLLYATCSLLDGENTAVVQQFLAATADASLAPLPQSPGVRTAAGCQLLPDPTGADGLFYSLLTKA